MNKTKQFLELERKYEEARNPQPPVATEQDKRSFASLRLPEATL